MNNFLKIFSNMDESSELLLFLIILVFLMLVSIFIINKITKNKTQKVNYTNEKIKKIEEITTEEKEEPIIEEIEEIKEPDKEIIKVNEKTSIDKIEELLEEGSKIDPIDLTKFEEEQEANAIISYDELVKRAGATKIIYEYDYSSNDVLSNEKLEEKEDKKFIASKVISPVYGVQKDEEEEIIDLEEFNDDRYKYQTEKDEKFLNSLKEFRSELN